MAKPVLKYAGKQPPLAIIAASKLSGIEIDVKEDLLNSGSSYETLVLPSGCGHTHSSCTDSHTSLYNAESNCRALEAR